MSRLSRHTETRLQSQRYERLTRMGPPGPPRHDDKLDAYIRGLTWAALIPYQIAPYQAAYMREVYNDAG